MEELSSTLIMDPDKIEGVVASIPSDVDPVRLLDGYSSEKLVRCQFCRTKQKHYRGFFVELSDGNKALAGNCCALKIGGTASVSKIKRNVERKEKTANVLREKHILLDRLSLLFDLVAESWLPAEEQLNRDIAELYSFMGIVDYPQANGFYRVCRRISEAKHLCETAYYKHKERAVHSLQIAVKAIESAHDEFIKTSGSLERSSVGNQLANCPMSQQHGKGVLVMDEISFRIPHPYDGSTSRVAKKLPVLTIPEDDIEQILKNVTR